METMLDAHPQVWGLGEDSVFNSRLPAFQTEFVAEVSKGDIAAANDVIAKFGSDILNSMKRNLQRDVSVSNEKKKAIRRIVDKMLFNYNNLGMLHMIFPNAPIIHMMRDPMDTLFSCYKHKFDEEGLRWSLDFELLVDQYVAYLEIMAHFRKVLPGRVYDVRYEELVEDPERVMRGVLKHIGLSWDASILEFHRKNRTVQTHSSSLVRQRLYSSSIGGWTKYAAELTPMIKLFRKYLPRLKKQRALPFPKKINWRMDPNFPYLGRSTSSENIEINMAGDSVPQNIGVKHTHSPLSRLNEEHLKNHSPQPSKVEDEAIPQVKRNSLQSVKPYCYKHVQLNELQAQQLISSFSYNMESNDASRLLACAYVIIS